MTLSIAVDTRKTIPQKFVIKPGEVRNVLISFARALDTSELVDSITDISVALHEQDQDSDVKDEDDVLTVNLTTAVMITDSNNAIISGSSVTIVETGEIVPVGEGVTFTLTATSATVGVWNRVSVKVATDATNPQTIIVDILVKVVDR